MRLMFWVGFWTFLLDQVSKYYVLNVLNLREVGTVEVLPPFVVFRMAWNYGINFGLFQGDDGASRWILIAIACAITVGVTWWMSRERPGRRAMVSAGLLVGGAMGNVIDRILFGGVADFLNMSCCGIRNPYSFNVADIAIFIGALGLILFTGGDKSAKTP